MLFDYVGFVHGDAGVVDEDVSGWSLRTTCTVCLRDVHDDLLDRAEFRDPPLMQLSSEGGFEYGVSSFTLRPKASKTAPEARPLLT
jgi:hypothetical protein